MATLPVFQTTGGRHSDIDVERLAWQHPADTT